MRDKILMNQTTIATGVSCSGIGLHTGERVRMQLRPAPENTGVVFQRTDLGGPPIPAISGNVSGARFSTCLAASGREVRTVEHLLSAAYGMAVDNLIVEIDGPEVPILDGSAAPYVRLLTRAGIANQSAPRRYLKVRRPIEVSERDSCSRVFPSRHLQISYAIDFEHPSIPYQEFRMTLSPARYQREVAAARTFCRLEDVQRLREMGLGRGGSLNNAVVVSRDGLLNGGLRFRDEFVRHKVLDLLGDLFLAGFPLLGHIVAYRAGHSLHTRLVRKLISTGDAWDFALQNGLPADSVPLPAPMERPVLVGGAIS